MSSVVDLCLCSNKHIECYSSVGPVQTQNKRLCFPASAIRCYSCKDYTASCSKQRDCSYDDACLTLNERGVYMCPHYAKILVDTNCLLSNNTFLDLISNVFCLNSSVLLLMRFCSDSAVLAAGGMTYRQCLKYSECEYSRLGQMFPQVTSQTHFHSFPHSQQVVGLIRCSCSPGGSPDSFIVHKRKHQDDLL